MTSSKLTASMQRSIHFFIAIPSRVHAVHEARCVCRVIVLCRFIACVFILLNLAYQTLTRGTRWIPVLAMPRWETLVFSGRTFYTGLYQKRTKSLKSDCIALLVCRDLHLTVSRAQRTGFLVHAFFQNPEYGL